MDSWHKNSGWLLGPWILGRFCFVASFHDLWVGLCWEHGEGVLYVAPLPGLIFGIRIREPLIELQDGLIIDLYEAIEGTMPNECTCDEHQLNDAACACGFELGKGAIDVAHEHYFKLIRRANP